LSRIPPNRLTKTNGQSTSPCSKESAQRADQALALFGADAPTAVAFCAVDAWLDGEEEEYRSLAGLFRRLSN